LVSPASSFFGSLSSFLSSPFGDSFLGDSFGETSLGGEVYLGFFSGVEFLLSSSSSADELCLSSASGFSSGF